MLLSHLLQLRCWSSLQSKLQLGPRSAQVPLVAPFSAFSCGIPPYLVSVTVLEVIQRGTDFLTRKGVDSPRLQIELLLAHVLQLPRLKLYLNFERTLSDAEVNTLREMVRRRGEREPLQHIVGSACFCGLEIAVNRHVLVPRPETEILAERGWRFLNQRQNARALDLGTGSGCLAIALAVKCPSAHVLAVDQSAMALECAKANTQRHEVEQRVELLQSNGFESCPRDLQADLLISNPPYVPSGEIQTLQPEVRDYDPRLALDGGKDGLDFFRHIAAVAAPLLAPDARVMLEFGDGQESALPGIFSSPWQIESIEKDYTGRPRFLIASHARK
jgi:release factor glutamine methyltransferase